MSTTEAPARTRNLFSAALQAARRILTGQTTVVIGLQWGDEGKGKFMDFIADFFDWMFRFSGGGNAGHTVHDETGTQFVLHFFPASVLRGKPAIIGRDVFLDVRKAEKELADLRTNGVKLGPIYIDRGASIWTSWHPLIEQYIERCKGNNATGTTGQAIVAFALLNTMRMKIRADDCLRSKTTLLEILEPIEKALSPWFKELHQTGKLGRWESAGGIANEILSYAEFLRPYLADTSLMLHESIKNGRHVALEGAQGVALHPIWGIEPFVSLGQSNSAGAANSCGIPHSSIDCVVGVFKPIVTKVGAGPFMSEIGDRARAEAFPKIHTELFKPGQARSDFLDRALLRINDGEATGEEEANFYQVRGYERGATSGRGRSVGYLDLAWLKYALRINGPDYLALNKIDMLDGVEQIKVVTRYMLDGTPVAPGALPDERRLSEVVPVCEIRPGWTEPSYGCQSWEDLPSNTQRFVEWIEEELDTTIIYVGTGPNRDHLVIRELVDARRRI